MNGGLEALIRGSGALQMMYSSAMQHTGFLRVVAGSLFVFGLLFAPDVIPASAAEEEANDQLEFEVALQALAESHNHLAAAIFRELAARSADDDPEKLVFDALSALAGGQKAASEEAMKKALEIKRKDYTQPWVYDELIRRAAEKRLAELRDQNTAELEELLARHYEARGGLERLLALDDLAAAGRMIVADQHIPFLLFRKRPNYYRLDIATTQGSRITACDGQIAWQLDPAVEGSKPEVLSGGREAELLRQSPFDEILVRYKDTGERLFFSGKENLDSTEAYRIEIDIPNSNRNTVFLDAETLLETKRLVWAGPEGTPPVEISYEYTEVDGLPVPKRQTIKTATTTIEYVFDDYELNQPFDPRIFEAASVNDQISGQIQPQESDPTSEGAEE
jgi:outer membrane lipoprotein-sorting protein